MDRINEGAMASPKMLVAQGCRLGGLRARVVGSLNDLQIHSIDGLPLGPNASRVRAAYISALGGYVFGVNHFTTFFRNKEIFMKVLM